MARRGKYMDVFHSKARSPARLSLRLLVKFSRPLLAVPDSEKLNWLSMPIDQQNLTNKRRALSREEDKAQLRCQRRWTKVQPTKAVFFVLCRHLCRH
jgi:hypothetical protein